jgi:chromosome segregation ATPase
MAGNDKTKVIDMPAEDMPQYKPAAERFSKLSEQAGDRWMKLTDRQTELQQKHATVTDEARAANKALEEVALDTDRQIKSLDTLKQQHDTLAKELDAAKAAGDTAKVQDLDQQIAKQQGDIDSAQRQLGETQARLDTTQAATEAKLKELTELDGQVKAVDDQVSKYQLAMNDLASTAGAYDRAAHYQDLATQAAAGEPADVTKAVLAEADKAADRFHEIAKDQAETFEKLESAKANLKALEGEREISARDQTKLQADVKRAQDAGRTDEAASLQKELDWRTQRLNEINTKITDTKTSVQDLDMFNQSQHQAAQEARQEAQELRDLSNKKPEEIEAKFTEKARHAEEEATMMTPVNADELEKEVTTPLPGDPPADPNAPTDGTPTSDATDGSGGTDGTATATDPTAGNDGTIVDGAAADPGATLDDLGSTAGGASDANAGDGQTAATAGTDATDGQAAATSDAQATAASQPAASPEADPGASLDDIGTPSASTGAGSPQAPASPADGTADATGDAAAAAPVVVDSDMLADPQPASATIDQPDDSTPPSASQPVDFGSPDPDTAADPQPDTQVFDEPQPEPTFEQPPEPDPEPEPEAEPEPEPEFAE